MDTVTIGKIIRKRRKEKGITQDDVNQLCGTGNRFLSELERGKEGAKLGLVLKVLHWLNLDLIVVPSDMRNTPEYRKLQVVMNNYTNDKN